MSRTSRSRLRSIRHSRRRNIVNVIRRWPVVDHRLVAPHDRRDRQAGGATCRHQRLRRVHVSISRCPDDRTHPTGRTFAGRSRPNAIASRQRRVFRDDEDADRERPEFRLARSDRASGAWPVSRLRDAAAGQIDDRLTRAGAALLRRRRRRPPTGSGPVGAEHNRRGA